ncbi:alpha/beta hydrolase [Candidatus Woesearchaeota archaeon]|nr:alpha/beta hydrolase [Candidatus Woesearchaeota archaeon]
MIPAELKGKKLNVEGVQIYYEILNRDPVLIYLHGNSTNHTVFSHQRGNFHSLGAGSLAPDLRGEGRSAHLPDAGSYALDSHVSDLEKLVQAEGIGNATIVAHSRGTMVAQAYAAKHPENVDALVLISASYDFLETFRKHGPAWMLSLKFLAGPLGVAYNRLAGLAHHNREDYYPDFSSEKFRKISDLSFALEIYGRVSPSYVRSINAIGKAVDMWNMESTAPLIKSPTLLIHGGADWLVPPRAAYELQEMIPGAKGIPPVIVPNARHGVHFQAPEQVTAAMEKFLVGEIYQGRLRPPLPK